MCNSKYQYTLGLITLFIVSVFLGLKLLSCFMGKSIFMVLNMVEIWALNCLVLLNLIRIFYSSEIIRIETVYHLAIQSIVPFAFKFHILVEMILAISIFLIIHKSMHIRRIVSFFVILLVFLVLPIEYEEDKNEVTVKTEIVSEEDMLELKIQLSDLELYSVEEKLLIAQRICEIECRYLSLPTIDVTSGILDGEKAYFEWRKEGKIVIASDYLQTVLSGDDLVQTILHETYHWLQFHEVQAFNAAIAICAAYEKLPVFQEVSRYKYEAENYIDGDKGTYSEYANQLLEKNARLYASTRFRFYMAEEE